MTLLTVAVHDWDGRVNELADKIAASPFRRIVLCVEERHVKWRADNVLEAVETFRDCGLQVLLDPWGVGNLFAGESNSSSGQGEGQRDEIEAWMKLAFSSTANGILWDEPKSGSWAGTLDYCINAQMNYAPDMDVVLALQPERDLFRWSADRRVDEVSVSTYMFENAIRNATPKNIHDRVIEWDKKIPENASVWIQTWKIDSGFEWIPAALANVWYNNAPHRNINVWSWNATDTVSAIRPAAPEAVWERLITLLISQQNRVGFRS